MGTNRTDVLHGNMPATIKSTYCHRLNTRLEAVGYFAERAVSKHSPLQGMSHRANAQNTPIVDAKPLRPLPMREKVIWVLVMDDAPVVRRLIVDLLVDLDGVDHIIEAVDAPSAVAMASQKEPQIAILDIKVPGNGVLRNGIDVLRHLKKMQPDMKVIMLTNHATALYKAECMSAGATYFFDKTNEFDELPLVVEELVRGMHLS